MDETDVEQKNVQERASTREKLHRDQAAKQLLASAEQPLPSKPRAAELTP